VGNLLNELSRLEQTVEIEQVCISSRRQGRLAGSGVISATHGNSDMLSAWQTDNDIRIDTSANTDDLDLLSAERVIGMGYGY
jgi:hypothetical protein